MSIIYEALKKVEGQKEVLAPESVPQDIALPGEREEKKINKEKKMSFLPAVLLLIVLGLLALLFILPRQEKAKVQEQEVIASVVAEKKEIDSTRVYGAPEPRSQVSEEVIPRKEPVQKYVLEGIVYDPKAPFALINGKVVKESSVLDNFQIDRISKDRVDMINIKDNSKVILSLP